MPVKGEGTAASYWLDTMNVIRVFTVVNTIVPASIVARCLKGRNVCSCVGVLMCCYSCNTGAGDK